MSGGCPQRPSSFHSAHATGAGPTASENRKFYLLSRLQLPPAAVFAAVTVAPRGPHPRGAASIRYMQPFTDKLAAVTGCALKRCNSGVISSAYIGHIHAPQWPLEVRRPETLKALPPGACSRALSLRYLLTTLLLSARSFCFRACLSYVEAFADEARLWSAALQVGAAAAGGLWHRRLPSLRAWRPILVM